MMQVSLKESDPAVAEIMVCILSLSIKSSFIAFCLRKAGRRDQAPARVDCADCV